jgi:YD repeat-containing protein
MPMTCGKGQGASGPMRNCPSRGFAAPRIVMSGLILLATLALGSSLRAQSTTGVQYVHDGLGRLVKAIDENGNVATYTYDAAGNLLSITRTTLSSPAALAIFGFTPGQGPIGATVTIQGQSFSTTPSADTVAGAIPGTAIGVAGALIGDPTCVP